MGLVSVAHTGWDVPGCGDILGQVRRGTSECGPYWLVHPGMSLVVGKS